MNNRSLNCLLGLSVLFLSGVAGAQQNIGSGVYVCDGAAQAGPCQPGNDDDSTAGHSQPVAKWADRWGAIADGSNEAGMSVGAPSKREAEDIAISDCKSRGGQRCRVLISYYNQCAAMAASTETSKTYSAPTEEKAKELAMRECEKTQGGGKCWVYYSGCSLPERIQ